MGITSAAFMFGGLILSTIFAPWLALMGIILGGAVVAASGIFKFKVIDRTNTKDMMWDPAILQSFSKVLRSINAFSAAF